MNFLLNLILIFVICSQLFFNISVAIITVECGEWEVYYDEKCVKVFADKNDLKSYNEAERLCSLNENSKLISIHSREENEFILKLVYDKHNIRSDVWIGAKYHNNVMKWSDNTSSVNHTNIFDETKDIDSETDSCVHMSLRFSSFGKWIKDSCGNRNVVVCQKKQNNQCLYLNKEMLEMRMGLENQRNQMIESLRNSFSAALLDFKTEIVEHLSFTNRLLQTNRNELLTINNDLNNAKIKINKLVVSNAVADCLLTDIWSDCKLFVDSNKNIHQILAIPKNVNEKVGSWQNAMNICAKYNSSLISIESMEKQKFIESSYPHLIRAIFWTSARKDATKDGKWKWSNGNELHYENWAKCGKQRVHCVEQPDNAGGVENCVDINCHGKKIPQSNVPFWSWCDGDCGWHENVMCEFAVNL